MKTITLSFLKKIDACFEAVREFEKDWPKKITAVKAVERLIKENKLDWANWLIVRCMSYKQYVSYAVFAAEQVLSIFEKKYPDDKRPRQAIEAAKKCIKSLTKENKEIADAAYAAYAASAASAAYAADAAYAAYAAVSAADVADADYATSATSAASAAASAVYAAQEKMKIKILEYGLKLLKGGKKCIQN